MGGGVKVMGGGVKVMGGGVKVMGSGKVIEEWEGDEMTGDG